MRAVVLALIGFVCAGEIAHAADLRPRDRGRIKVQAEAYWQLLPDCFEIHPILLRCLPRIYVNGGYPGPVIQSRTFLEPRQPYGALYPSSRSGR